MFLTNTSGKSKFHSLLCAPDQQYWLNVELALKKPFFLITLHQTELIESGEEIACRRDFMLANATDILQIVKLQSDRIQKLESALILIPNWINGTGTWSAEQLSAIWVADEPEAPGAPVEICETQSGAEYVTTFGACDIKKLINKTLLYRFSFQEKMSVNL